MPTHLLGELEPKLRAARNQLRPSLAEGASFATLQQQHAAMEDLYDARTFAATRDQGRSSG